MWNPAGFTYFISDRTLREKKGPRISGALSFTD
jgi:hypothetical protein